MVLGKKVLPIAVIPDPPTLNINGVVDPKMLKKYIFVPFVPKLAILPFPT